MLPNELNEYKKQIALLMLHRLRQQPDLISQVVALNNMQLNREKIVCKPEYLLAWDDLLNTGIDAIENMVNEDSDRSQVLLSCSPLGALWKSQEERMAFYDEFKEKWKSGYYQK